MFFNIFISWAVQRILNWTFFGTICGRRNWDAMRLRTLRRLWTALPETHET